MVRLTLLTLIVNLLNRRPSPSPISVTRLLLKVQEEMNISGTPEKTPPVPRKKIRGVEYGGEHRWSGQDRAVIEKMKRYLDRSESLEGY